MKIKKSGLSSSGKTQPKNAHEPMTGDRYQDTRGQRVTVTQTDFNRIAFTRDGYPAPNVMPQSRFITEFTFTGETN